MPMSMENSNTSYTNIYKLYLVQDHQIAFYQKKKKTKDYLIPINTKLIYQLTQEIGQARKKAFN